MSSDDAGRRVLAIGLDAAEATLVRRMIDAGDLPALKSLLDRGTWRPTTSPVRYSSGSVWPNFYTGQDAYDHGQFARWNWDPVAMRMVYTDVSRLTPFWKALVEDGTTVGVVDVPFSPCLGLATGFEICEWGPHDRIEGRVHVSPPSVAEQVSKFRPHPFADDLASPPEDASGMAPFLDQCIEGVRRRGDLAEHLVAEIQPDVSVVVFPEPHHAGHFLWYTVEPDPQFYGDLLADGMPSQTLKDLYRELDRQVGRLVAAAGPDTAVLVFALHGMELARGVPSVLEPLLEQLGMACLDESTGRRRSILSRVKARVPERLRNVYRRSVPLSRRSQWGQSAILPSYDWSRTRAFVLPIEHEGQIRLNLAGREAEGIVPPEQYDEVCESIEKAVRALTTADGRPIVRDVVRPPRGAHLNGLPDLVVHWHRAAFESSIRLGEVDAPLIRRWQTGQHAPDGFCIANGPASAAVTAEPIPAEEMHRVIVAALGR